MAPSCPRRPKSGQRNENHRQTRTDRHKQELTRLNHSQKRSKDELERAAIKAKADNREIRKLREQADENGQEIRRLRHHLATQAPATDEHVKFQDSLINFGTKAVQEQRLRAEAAEQEVSRLKALSADLESSRAILQDQVGHFELAMHASADDFTRSALEAQAQRSVYMVRGYQNDVAREQNAVEKLRRTVSARDSALRESERKSKEQALELEEAKKQLAAYERRAEGEREVTNEQASLIKRLNEENARLAKLG
ncbi:hypothetical protein CERZMDRAFT_97086 [Cercospora zeae-maydis SCOH1-5]|uniref:Uncharacterized protein n=1 Tax=Cercospora zeae-maydis SCOH1-5 TaxID=717836 RepID=A0A6A6FH73_9PEZI|nr:hypothetical protein CERZMDRAFT_97086 [Cercospora zeae-maydis SCOH1-5]